MNLGTMDWELEAVRVAGAFGVAEECEFRNKSNSGADDEFEERLFCLKNAELPLVNEFKMSVTYMKTRRIFVILNPQNHCVGQVFISWQGQSMFGGFGSFGKLPLMTRALFHLGLGLLTPEIEAALNVNISAHEKAEWLLEFETRCK